MSLLAQLKRQMGLSMSGSITTGAPPAVGPVPTPYSAASIGRRMMNWRPTGAGPNAVTQLDAPEMVRRSRDLRRNNPMAKRGMDLLATHIVGTGIKPRSLCTNAKVRTALMELWGDWTKVADADGVLDFYGMQALAASEMIEGGETFARLRARKLSDGLPVPLQVQLLPCEQVPVYYGIPNGPNTVIQAVERNPVGQRVAYWIYRYNPMDMLPVGQIVDVAPLRVPAKDVCHLYNVARIGQLRGLPWLAASITTLHQVNQYLDAELLRKQLVAALVAFVTNAPSVTPTISDLADKLGQVEQALGELPTVSMEPGTIQYLAQGEDVKFNAPADVGSNFDAFLAANYRAVAASANLLYEELTGDWKNTNDRTFRTQFNTFKRTCRQWQWNLVGTQFNEPVWQRFVDYALASGALAVPKGVTEADLRRVEWRPERWEYINPVQDVEATGLEMGLGLKSRTAVVTDRGDDIEVVDAQIVADHEREASLGLAFGQGLGKASKIVNLTKVDEQEGNVPGDASASGTAPPNSQNG